MITDIDILDEKHLQLEILRKITRLENSARNKTERAKSIALSVPNIKGGFFGIGRQKKINTAFTEAHLLTNEAVMELTQIQQETIIFACSSLRVAEAMSVALTKRIEANSNRIDKLSHDTTSALSLVLVKVTTAILQLKRRNQKPSRKRRSR
jgi:hypothetical protein